MQPESSEILAKRHIVLGVGGGIAAYKAAELVRLLVKAGAIVDVVMTRAAQEFITPLTLQALSGRPVATELFDLVQESQIGHIALADRAELLLIAPATADLVARLSLGLGDDLLTTLALACRAPLLVAPAMNVNMWQHPSVQDNLARLVQRGAHVVGPGAGELACGWIGAGRLVEPVEIVAAARQVLLAKAAPAPVRDLDGVRLLVTAGPTYEALDPVRFLGNRSSGKMGFALAERAARRGAEVTLVAGPVTLPTPPGVRRIDVESAAEMAEAVLPRSRAENAEATDVIIMAAAVADFRPAAAAPRKLKKSTLGEQPRIELVPTLDILAELGRSRTGHRPLLVGFAAETNDVLGYASRKLREKRCDLIVANDVAEPGSGFGTETNRVTLLERPAAADAAQPEVSELPQLPKGEVAERILDRVVELIARERGSASESL
ncbi:MAG: bifunctional phosphopantothenoylcysteine decarboxylase/phosphopantothenate--cysteine ligase CoaBC [Polyangia bacterium]